MPRYIINDLATLSYDHEKFPLLSSLEAQQDCYDAKGVSWSRLVNFHDNSKEPLFIGGLLTSTEIGFIAKEIARELVDRCHGQKVLLVQILEGALPFCKMVCDNLSLSAAGIFQYDLAAIKVSSYLDGTRATSHCVSQPLRLVNGDEITTLDNYDLVVILDDLIDAGNTFAWLVDEYLPPFNPKQIAAYFMLEKDRKRDLEVDRALEKLGVVCGKRIPNEWVVGCGLDIRLLGRNDQPPIHLFRSQLPGGVYAFNSSIEEKLISEFHKNPQQLQQQLQVFVSFS